MYGKRALRVAKLLFSVLVISHWLCCGWFFAGDTTPRPGKYIPDEVVEGWVSETYPAAVRSAGIAWDMYFQTWFWASMTTISSPTPGTAPDTWEEKVMYMVGFGIGTLVISTIIGQVSDMIAHANPGEKHQSEAVGMVHGFLRERHVTPMLTRRV